MKFLQWWIAIGIVVFLGQVQLGSARADTLERLWAMEKINPQPLSDNLKATLGERHFVLVPGLMNGLGYWVSGYFQTMRLSIQEIIGQESPPTYVGLWSFVSTEKNADGLALELRTVYQKVRKPLVILAHSKGGTEVLLAILRDPGLILEGIIDRAIILQGAIKGSPLLSCAESNAPFYKKFLQRSAFLLLREGLNSLRPEVAEKILDENYAEFEQRTSSEQRDEISSRISYILSYSKEENRGIGVYLVLMGSPTHLDFLTFSANEELETSFHHRQHDGILRLVDQMYEKLGSVLGVIEADHMKLVQDRLVNEFEFKVSSESKRSKQALLRAVLRMIYEPHTVETLFEEDPAVPPPLPR